MRESLQNKTDNGDEKDVFILFTVTKKFGLPNKCPLSALSIYFLRYLNPLLSKGMLIHSNKSMCSKNVKEQDRKCMTRYEAVQDVYERKHRAQTKITGALSLRVFKLSPSFLGENNAQFLFLLFFRFLLCVFRILF